eukprot:30375-Eustigmatos_ZCMA.PRE.1
MHYHLTCLPQDGMRYMSELGHKRAFRCQRSFVEDDVDSQLLSSLRHLFPCFVVMTGFKASEKPRPEE